VLRLSALFELLSTALQAYLILISLRGKGTEVCNAPELLIQERDLSLPSE